MLSHFYHFEYFILIAILLGCSLVCIGFWMAPEGWRKTSKGRKTTIVLGGLISLGSSAFTVMDMSHVSEEDLEAWISEYDPLLAAEPDGYFPIGGFQEFTKAVNLHRRGGGTCSLDGALAGEAVNAKWSTDLTSRQKLPLNSVPAELASVGLLTLDSTELVDILQRIRKLHLHFLKEYGSNALPCYWDRRQWILPLAQTDLLSEEDRVRLIDELVAGILWETNREGVAEEWVKTLSAPYATTVQTYNLHFVRARVEMLIALNATEGLAAVEESVQTALASCYRPWDASFRFDNREEKLSAKKRTVPYLLSADNALFLMEHYGFPDFLDLPGFHKYLDKERTGRSPHSPQEYLAAALMFRLEQLHPEL